MLDPLYPTRDYTNMKEWNDVPKLLERATVGQVKRARAVRECRLADEMLGTLPNANISAALAHH